MSIFRSRPALAASTVLAGPVFRGIGADASADAERTAKAADYQRRAANLAAGRAEDDDGDDDDMKKQDKARRAKNKAEGRDEDDDGGPNDDDDDGKDDDEEGDDEGDRDDMADKEGKGKGKDKGKGKASAASIIRAARLRERARMAAILHSAGAKANVEAALKIALMTDLGRDQAVQLIATLPAAASPQQAATLAGRMAERDGINAGRDAPRHESKAAAIDAGWDNAVAAHAVTPKK